MFRSGIATAIACSVAIALVACQPVAAPPANPDAALVPLVGTEWVLNEMQGEHLVHEGNVTAHFGEEGKLAGSAGCNDYSTRYVIDGDSIAIDPNIESPPKVCEDAAMAVESLYLASLQSASSYELEAEVMFMRDADGTVTLVYDAEGR